MPSQDLVLLQHIDDDGGCEKKMILAHHFGRLEGANGLSAASLHIIITRIVGGEGGEVPLRVVVVNVVSKRR